VSNQETGLDELGVNRVLSYSTNSENDKLLKCTTNYVCTCYFNPSGNSQYFNQPSDSAYVKKPPSPWPPEGVSVHSHTSEVAIFLANMDHGPGLDGITSSNRLGRIVHYTSFINFPGNTAYWHSGHKAFFYGRHSKDMPSYASAMTIVAHEIFHGVIYFICKLGSAKEPGALNESLADIFGILLENRKESNIGNWIWELGIPETPSNIGFPIRDLRNPRRFDNPEHMREYVDMEEDNGGVHSNNGIHNKAAYNLLTSRNERGEYLFSMDSAAFLFYCSLYELRESSTFADSRIALTIAAGKCFPERAEYTQVVSAIEKAFDLVGITLDSV
jgi:Zn-dependent metalloprotease